MKPEEVNDKSVSPEQIESYAQLRLNIAVNLLSRDYSRMMDKYEDIATSDIENASETAEVYFLEPILDAVWAAERILEANGNVPIHFLSPSMADTVDTGETREHPLRAVRDDEEEDTEEDGEDE